MSEVLLRAVRAGDIEEVDSILAEGASIHYQNDEGRAALHEAVLGLDEDMTTYLLQKGAQVNQLDFDNLTPLNCAYDEYNHDSEAPLLPIVEILLNAGADLTLAPKGTLVCWAAFNGFLGIVNRLIEAEADLTGAEAEAIDGGYPQIAARIRHAQDITDNDLSSEDDSDNDFRSSF